MKVFGLKFCTDSDSEPIPIGFPETVRITLVKVTISDFALTLLSHVNKLLHLSFRLLSFAHEDDSRGN